MSNAPKKRINVITHSPWEPLRGFSRAVVIGDTLHISGTTAQNNVGEVIGGQSAYEQTKYVFEKIRKILNAAHFELKDVVRTRMYVTQISKWDEYAKAHREFFDTIRPASSLVQVARLVDPRLLVEVEVEAQKFDGEQEVITLQDLK
jgi:enamine deaminase RidA (YjgF/YER057c/UK114 family)